MADIRINALATTASSTASDDFLAVDGSANGTRKLNAYSPTFGGNLTVSGGTITGGASGMSLAAGGTNQDITLTPSGTGKVTLSNGTSAQPMLDITNTNTVPTKNGLRILGPNATSSSARQFALIANSIAYGDLELRRSTTNTGDPTSGDYIFGVSATGNFLVGTTIDGGQKLQVSGTAYVSGNLSSGGIVSGISNLVQLWGNLSGASLPGNASTVGANVIGWNYSGGGGEMNFINARGAGGVGGFKFTSWDGTTATAVADFSRTGQPTFYGTATVDNAVPLYGLAVSGVRKGFLYFNGTDTILGSDTGGVFLAAANGTVAINSGQALQLGTAYVAGAPTATGYITIKDSSGTTYKVPAVAA